MPIDRIGQSSDPDRAAAVASVVGIGIVGVFAYYMLPMTIGAIADALTLRAAEAGFIASAELAGMAVLSLTISAGIRKWDRRYMAAGCIAVMVLGNLLSMIASDAFSMGVCRFVAGCGEGGLMSMMSAGIANTRQPERYFAYFVIGGLMSGTLGFKVMGPTIASYEATGAFLLMAAVALAALPFTLWFPAHAASAASTVSGTRAQQRIPWVYLSIGLAGILLFTVGAGGLWPHVERIGTSSGLPSAAVVNALSTSTLAGLLGAMTAAWLGRRAGLAVPLLIATAILLASLLWLAVHPTPLRYFVGIGGFMLGWMIALPYFAGTIAALDSSGRGMTLNMTVQLVGAAVGPSFIAISISGERYAHAITTSAITAGVGTILVLIVVRRISRRGAHATETTLESKLIS